jgi:hypothetical protein
MTENHTPVSVLLRLNVKKCIFLHSSVKKKRNFRSNSLVCSPLIIRGSLDHAQLGPQITEIRLVLDQFAPLLFVNQQRVELSVITDDQQIATTSILTANFSVTV